MQPPAESIYERINRKAEAKRRTHYERAAARVLVSSRRDPVRLPLALALERAAPNWWDRMKAKLSDANAARPVESAALAPLPDPDMSDGEWRLFVAETLRELYARRRQSLNMVS